MKTAIPLLLYVLCGATIAFQISIPSSQRWTLLAIQQEEDGYPVVVEPEDTKFGFFQRAESLKCFVVGSVVGSVALVPFALVHNLLLTPSMIDTNGLAQFEFATDASGIQTGLFAIVYRYCIRTDTNPQLQDGVVGAFAITRALSGIVIPPYCTAIVLNCGPPLGYLDWNLLGQLAVNGVESFAMFTATATAINYCMKRNIISKFE